MRIIILGLRRSGTTAFWRTWRQDERFVCYDEPFSQFNRLVNDPDWRDLPYTGIEKRVLWEKDPLAFWDHFVSIHLLDELRPGLSDHQQTYLAWLFESAEHVCIDLTRCHYKVSDLKQLAPDAVLVHLRRPPQNWLTSIALPSSEKLDRVNPRSLRAKRKFILRARNVLSRRRFWIAQHGFHFQGYEEILDAGAHSLFRYRISEAGLDAELVCGMPLTGRLLALWKVFSEEVEAEGPKHFGDRFISINFNAFCKSPSETISQVYKRMGEKPPPFDFSGIHPPSEAFQSAAPQWGRFFDAVQIDRKWLTSGDGI